MELSEHESASQRRYEDLKHHIVKGEKMSDAPHIKNVFEPVNPLGMMGYGGGWGGAGAGAGAGLGAGLLGGILGGAVLNRGGLFGADGRGFVGENPVTPSQLTAALAGVQDTQMNTNVLTQLAAIQAAIPAAEGQVQLALSQSQGQVMNQIGQQSLAIAQGFAGQAQNTAQAQAAIIAVGESVKDAVNANGSANLLATQQASSAQLAAIANSTSQILAAIKDGEITTLNRELSVAQNALAEQRAEGRARGTEINVTQQVTQNQAQLQAQAQAQSQAILLGNIWERLNGMQNAIATNSNLIVGNQGPIATGPQTANPVNVRT